MNKLIYLTLIIFFVSNVHALGSVVRNDFAVLGENESAIFTILFWSDEEEYVNLRLEEAPEGWIVIIEPESLKLNSTTGNEYIALPGGYNKKASSVNILVKPTSMIGRQHIIIYAASGKQEKGISFIQERYFNFTVETELIHSYSTETDQSINTLEGPEPEANALDENIRTENSYYLIYLVIILTIVSAILIYKYS